MASCNPVAFTQEEFLCAPGGQHGGGKTNREYLDGGLDKSFAGPSRQSSDRMAIVGVLETLAVR